MARVAPLVGQFVVVPRRRSAVRRPSGRSCAPRSRAARHGPERQVRVSKRASYEGESSCCRFHAIRPGWWPFLLSFNYGDKQGARQGQSDIRDGTMRPRATTRSQHSTAVQSFPDVSGGASEVITGIIEHFHRVTNSTHMTTSMSASRYRPSHPLRTMLRMLGIVAMLSSIGGCGVLAAPCRVTSAAFKMVPLIGHAAAIPTDACAAVIDP